MKLALLIDPKDDCLKDGGALFPKQWKVGGISIVVRSGYGENHGRQDYYGAFMEPNVYVHGEDGFYSRPDFSKPFDVPALQAAIKEANDEVAKMREFISQKFDEQVIAAMQEKS